MILRPDFVNEYREVATCEEAMSNIVFNCFVVTLVVGNIGVWYDEVTEFEKVGMEECFSFHL